jgi:predicted Zn finger-like uncharacterized protein
MVNDEEKIQVSCPNCQTTFPIERKQLENLEIIKCPECKETIPLPPKNKLS